MPAAVSPASWPFASSVSFLLKNGAQILIGPSNTFVLQVQFWRNLGASPRQLVLGNRIEIDAIERTIPPSRLYTRVRSADSLGRELDDLS
jgi:hypothetical protein